MLTNGFYPGKTAAGIARRILNGEKDIPVIRKSPNRYAPADFQAARAFRDRGGPAACRERRRQQTGVVLCRARRCHSRRCRDRPFMPRHHSLPVDHNSQKNRAERELRRYQDNLEVLVEERTEGLNFANAALTAEIQEREQVEAALRESEEKYRVLIEKANEAVVIVRKPRPSFCEPQDARSRRRAACRPGPWRAGPLSISSGPTTGTWSWAGTGSGSAAKAFPTRTISEARRPRRRIHLGFLSATTIPWKGRPATPACPGGHIGPQARGGGAEGSSPSFRALSQVKALSGLLPSAPRARG